MSKHEIVKAHMKNGDIAIVRSWSFDRQGSVLYGQIARYDINRHPIHDRYDSIYIDSVALFEANVPHGGSTTAALATMTVVTGVVALGCLFNPKACFGSCPTFYAWDGEGYVLQAEGFSSSILPSLEATDRDPLPDARYDGSSIAIRMTNEAYETHAVRSLALVAAPKEPGTRVYASPSDELYSVSTTYEPTACSAPEGDCIDQVRTRDSLDRISGADSSNLATNEQLFITFDDVGEERLGVLVGFRQSLMTTYLFYQALDYLGADASRFLAELESQGDGRSTALQTLDDLLGGIEIEARTNDGSWKPVGTIREAGPIAENLQLLELPSGAARPVALRVRMTKGLWRLDCIRLASIADDVESVRIAPSRVTTDARNDTAALETLLDPDRYLTTVRGDRYEVHFVLDGNAEEYELFLESTGYYLEWMRQDWDGPMEVGPLSLLMTNPRAFLQMEAPRFKELEESMEEQFWNSRYVPK